MAYRRMISKEVICKDAFLDMPFDAQALFFQLQVNADEYGFVGTPRGIMRMMSASAEALDTLIKNGFVIHFDSGVAVMAHWDVANTRRADRTAKVRFPAEYALLEVDEAGVYKLRDDNGMTMGCQRDDNGKPSRSLSRSHSVSQSNSPSVNPNEAIERNKEMSSSSYMSSSIETRAREENEMDDDDDPALSSLNEFLNGVPFLSGAADRVLAYREKLSDELIRYGVRRAMEYGGKSPVYVCRILDSFVDKQYTTVEQAEADEEKRYISKMQDKRSKTYDPEKIIETSPDGTKIRADGYRIMPDGNIRGYGGGTFV